MEDVALDETVDAKVHNEVVARLEAAEKKLRCLMGTSGRPGDRPTRDGARGARRDHRRRCASAGPGGAAAPAADASPEAGARRSDRARARPRDAGAAAAEPSHARRVARLGVSFDPTGRRRP